jgi:DtxR family Mn-dependent transcriptional regulator
MVDPLVALITYFGAIAFLLLLLRPGGGWFWRWRHARLLTERVRREDALKHLQKCDMQGDRPTVESVAGALGISIGEAARVLSELNRQNLVEMRSGDFRLTQTGRDAALHILRAHRLWERHLADETGVSEMLWHDHAERYEHRMSPEEVDALSARLGHPTHDPHGDPIPTSQGEFVAHGGRPLASLASGDLARIVHLEDEPDVIYAQLIAEGLSPGMRAQVTEVSPTRIRFWADGNEHVLAPIVAANISVVPVPALIEAEADAGAGARLSALRPGRRAKVVSISPRCRGAERRRLLDLGILPGTIVEAEMRSPGGDPTAYRVRDALIALREEQARLIRVLPIEETAEPEGVAT